jgi:hypothetical protein
MKADGKLWAPYDIPIVCIAGEPGSGKTLWGLTIDPDCLTWDHPATTILWDNEGSSAPYVGALNFKRVDIPAIIFNKGATRQIDDAYQIWKKDINSIEPGKYRIGIIDTVGEIEEGLAHYVRNHPTEFGYTTKQFDRMEGVMWGVMKSEWKRLLMAASQKFETLVLTTHMRDEFKGGKPTNRRQPKGKETIIQVASIYMTISRTVQAGSSVAPVRPSGICAWPSGKVRLLRLNSETSKLEPILPPFLTDASPSGVKSYFTKPPNFNKLKASERALPEEELTIDDRLRLQADIALNQSNRAQAELSKLEVEKELKMEVGKEKLSPVDLKARLLANMTTNEAKMLLETRYNVSLFIQLTVEQLTDLSNHLDSLGK